MCAIVFFSSRRRHTRYWRDWSSDVCSSDLPLYLTGAVLMVGYPWLAFSLWDENMGGQVHVTLTVLAITVGLIVHGLMYALQPAMFAELFPTSIRYTGVSIAAQLTSVATEIGTA